MKMTVGLIAASLLVWAAAPALSAEPDANAGAKLVESHGCTGCHGAQLAGGDAPKLVGIEHRLSRDQIVAAIDHPKPPMPSYGFTAAETANIVAYLSNLDGGAKGSAPVATLSPAKPSKAATLTVKFPGTPPKHVTAEPTMQMGRGSISTPKVTLKPTSDPHVWQGVVQFSMGGPWTIVILYDGKKLTLPVEAEGSM